MDRQIKRAVLVFRNRIIIFSLVSLLIIFILSACHGGDIGHNIGALCDDNSPCRDPYICEYGRCRSECKLDIDCDDGTCVQSAIDRDAYVCTLVIESSCKTNGCPKGLYCADDDVCRSGCDDSEDCLKDQVCGQHVCYSNAKIDNDSGSARDPDNENGNSASLDDTNVDSSGVLVDGGTSDTSGQGGDEAMGESGVSIGGAGGSGGENESGGVGGAVGSVMTATMFLPDADLNVVHRYTITPTADPVLTTNISVKLAHSVAIGSTGELFVVDNWTSNNNWTIYRFLSPLSAPIPNGAIIDVGLNFPQEMRFVDNELWILNATQDCSTEPQSIVRLALDSQGSASIVGTVQTDLIGANRGMLWVPVTRDLYVSQCHPVDTIQHFRVATDHSVTMLTPITGNGLNSPHAMVITEWGEMLVANFGDDSVLRFRIDAEGNITNTGTITGNGLKNPIGLALTPWEELLVVNADNANTDNALLSRFTFDASHAAVPNGTFQTYWRIQIRHPGLGWILIVP